MLVLVRLTHPRRESHLSLIELIEHYRWLYPIIETRLIDRLLVNPGRGSVLDVSCLVELIPLGLILGH